MQALFTFILKIIQNGISLEYQCLRGILRNNNKKKIKNN